MAKSKIQEEVIIDKKRIEKTIRKVQDFPKKGVLFYDITGLLTNPNEFKYCIEKIAAIYKEKGITKVAAIEARGFIFGAPVAMLLGVPLVLVRKKNKLPGETISMKYLLEYGEDVIEIHKSDINLMDNLLVVDDLIATGGTIKATCTLIESIGAKIEEVFAVVGLSFLDYKSKIGNYKVRTFINYENE